MTSWCLPWEPTRFQWFSTSSFAKPGPLQWGTAARNDVVSPGRNNWNVALFKAFQVKENVRFEFRAETFNTFNHTQFNHVRRSFGASDFLSATDTHDPRIMQFALKFIF